MLLLPEAWNWYSALELSDAFTPRKCFEGRILIIHSSRHHKEFPRSCTLTTSMNVLLSLIAADISDGASLTDYWLLNTIFYSVSSIVSDLQDCIQHKFFTKPVQRWSMGCWLWGDMAAFWEVFWWKIEFFSLLWCGPESVNCDLGTAISVITVSPLNNPVSPSHRASKISKILMASTQNALFSLKSISCPFQAVQIHGSTISKDFKCFWLSHGLVHNHHLIPHCITSLSNLSHAPILLSVSLM